MGKRNNVNLKPGVIGWVLDELIKEYRAEGHCPFENDVYVFCDAAKALMLRFVDKLNEVEPQDFEHDF